MKPYALFILVSACVTLSCKTQHAVTTPRDTVVITERVTVVDTLLLKDTVTIVKDRLRIQLRRLPGDTVVIRGECAPDTVRIKTTHIEYNTKELERSQKWVGSLFMLSLVLAILLLLKR